MTDITARQVRAGWIGGWVMATAVAVAFGGEGVSGDDGRVAADAQVVRGPVVEWRRGQLSLAEMRREAAKRMIVGVASCEQLCGRGMAHTAARETVVTTWRTLAGMGQEQRGLWYGAQGGVVVVELAACDDADAVCKQMESLAGVRYVQEDVVCLPTGLVANDPLFDQQWHHDRIGSPQVWDAIVWNNGITCAVVDTGIDLDHPEFAGRIGLGYNAVSELNTAQGGSVGDVTGHGTQVAGVLGATGNNGQGVAGVNWGTTIMPVRVTNRSDGAAFLSDILEGARWAADNGAWVISCSYTGVQHNATQDAGAYIKAKGGLFVYSAGNTPVEWDFDHPDVMIVGSTTSSDALTSFSPWGPAIDVVAPGTSIVTTAKGGRYVTVNGSSYSAPIAAGVASMVWSALPALTPGQVEQIMYGTCEDLGPAGKDETFGHGLVDLGTAVCSLTLCSNGSDWNRDGIVNFFDLLAFLDDWYGHDADFDSNGITDFLDLLDYLSAWYPS